jgi:hypothetical protein
MGENSPNLVTLSGWSCHQNLASSQTDSFPRRLQVNPIVRQNRSRHFVFLFAIFDTTSQRVSKASLYDLDLDGQSPQTLSLIV